MKKSTLNRLTLVFILAGVGSYALGHGEMFDWYVANAFRNLFMVCLIVLPLLLFVRVVSAIFLPAMGGSSVQTLELVYGAVYMFLTEEARVLWVKEIEAQRGKAKK